METKPAYLSKTIWMNLIIAILVLVWPQGSTFIASHPDAVAIGWSLINIVLRVITSGKIQLA